MKVLFQLAKVRSIVLIFIFSFLVLTLHSQDRRDKFNYWTIQGGGGATLFFGDMSDDAPNPFSKYFTVQQGWAGSLSLQKKLSPVFAIDLQGTVGNWHGQRSQWSDGKPVSFEFNSLMKEGTLMAEIDLLNIIKPKTRTLNFYLKGGVGYVFYDAIKTDYALDTQVGKSKGSAFVLPWGFGGRIDFNERWSFYGETSFQYAFDDNLDAHASTFTKANDIYTYTSFGIGYKIFPEKRKPVIKEIDVAPIDTIVVAELLPIKVLTKAPKTLEPGSEFVLRIQINKDAHKGGAKIQQTLPVGMTASASKSADGTFAYNNQIMTIDWEELPENEETLFIEYKIKVAETIDEKEYILPGIMYYDKDGEENIAQFRTNVTVKTPVVAIVVPDSNIGNTSVDIKENPNNSDTELNNSDIVYRVQVKAIYGGKSTKQAIAKRYGVTGEINEDYHNGYMKYTAGNYSNYSEAAKLKQELRNGKVPGAFVVAYNKGKRMSNIQEAIKITETGGGSTTSSSTIEYSSGTSYKIQIAASARDFSSEYIKNTLGVSNKVEREKHNGLYKYTVGNYTSFNEAKHDLPDIKSKVFDAYIVKYLDGKR